MKIEKILEEYKMGELSKDDVLNEIKLFSYEDLTYAKVDHHRELRNGFSEVIFCPGKKIEHILGIVKSFVEKNSDNIVLSRAEPNVFEAVLKEFPNTIYYDIAKIVVVNRKEFKKKNGSICIVSAGTADMPVAKEAYHIADILGNHVYEIYDVGVAGIHRLLSKKEEIGKADVIIVVAGMEGALASVVGGLFDKPIIAVPTSIGYGTGTGGIAALLSMLNSCASGMSVVNIDNGFGAACMANKIINLLN